MGHIARRQTPHIVIPHPLECHACIRFLLPRYDDDLECAHAPDRLNFALHVRMGDRRAFQEGTLEYFELLEAFMNTVSSEVVKKGLEPPLFHIFSETLVPCPSSDTGLFDEFPSWPVVLDQVRISQIDVVTC